MIELKFQTLVDYMEDCPLMIWGPLGLILETLI